MQVGLQGLGRLIALVLNMVTFAVILSGLTPAGYGTAALALTLTEGAGTVAAFGIDKAVFRALSVDELDGRGLGAAVLVRIAFAASVGLLAIGLVLLLPDGALRTPLVVALAAMPIAALITVQQVLRARVRLVPFAIADVTGSALTLGLVVAFSMGGLRPVEVVLGTVLSNLVVWLALAVVASRELRPRFAPGRLRADVRGLLRRSRMLGVGDATVVAYYRADVIALGATTGGAALGIYAAAYRFVDIAMYAQAIVIGAFFPRIARAWSDPVALRALLREVSGFLLALAVIAFVTVVTLGPAVIEAFGGSSYGDITGLVSILMTVTAVMFVNRLLIQALIAGGFAGRQAVCWLGGVAGALLAFPLSAFFAERGAGTAMLIGELLILAIAARQLGALGALPPPVMPGAGFVAFVFFVGAALVAAVLPDAVRLPLGVAIALLTTAGFLVRVRRRGALVGA